MFESDTTSYKRKTISNFSWRFAEQLSSRVVGLIVSIVIARILSPDEFGLVALTLIFINIADGFAVSGFGTALVQKKDTDELDVNTMLYGGLAISIIIYVIIFLSAPIIASVYNNSLACPVLRIMGLRIPIASFNSIQQALVSRSLNFRNLFYSNLFATIISGIIGVIMAVRGYGVWALVGQYMSSVIIGTLVLNILIHYKPQLVFSYSRFCGMFAFAWKLMCTSAIGAFFNQLQGFVIGLKFTPADLAYYNRGGQFPSIVSQNISGALDSVLFSVMSKMQSDRCRIVLQS